MKLGIYSVRDIKADSFMQPYCCPNDGVAIRSFAGACAREGNQFAANPEDFALYCLGELDEQSGELVPALPRSVVTAVTILASRQ